LAGDKSWQQDVAEGGEFLGLRLILVNACLQRRRHGTKHRLQLAGRVQQRAVRKLLEGDAIDRRAMDRVPFEQSLKRCRDELVEQEVAVCPIGTRSH
jgi:hypothetical protein